MTARNGTSWFTIFLAKGTATNIIAIATDTQANTCVFSPRIFVFPKIANVRRKISKIGKRNWLIPDQNRDKISAAIIHCLH
jgi:hypothetical protein